MKLTLQISLVLLIYLCTSCNTSYEKDDTLSMIQIVDRSGTQETINQKEKLKRFENINFCDPQPYQKVTRVLSKNTKHQQKSVITTYHENGMINEYLETLAQRANGSYKEYYPNGNIKIEGTVVEGIADVSESAKASFIFDGICKVYYPDNTLMVTMQYSKGKLEGESIYYHTNGNLKKRLTYREDLLHGRAEVFDENGKILGFTEYRLGIKHGKHVYFGDTVTPPFEESYDEGLLMQGLYHDDKEQKISEIKNGFGLQVVFSCDRQKKEIEYRKGLPEGKVSTYYPSGNLQSVYFLKNAAKHGEEWIYFDNSKEIPKLFLQWYQDELHGSQKSWYENGHLESQKEMIHNQKHGQLIAWYISGEVMLIEEYELGKLKEGEYFSKNSQERVSFVKSGKGMATLYDPEGFFLHKISYDKGEIMHE